MQGEQRLALMGMLARHSGHSLVAGAAVGVSSSLRFKVHPAHGISLLWCGHLNNRVVPGPAITRLRTLRLGKGLLQVAAGLLGIFTDFGGGVG